MNRSQFVQAALRGRCRGGRQPALRGLFSIGLLVGCSVCNSALTAKASTIVAPNVFTTSEASTGTVGVFRGGNADLTFQWVFPASDFSTMPLGSPITAIGF